MADTDPSSNTDTPLADSKLAVAPTDLLRRLKIDQNGDNLTAARAEITLATQLVFAYLNRPDGFPTPYKVETRRFVAPAEGSRVLPVDDFYTKSDVAASREKAEWKLGGQIHPFPFSFFPELNEMYAPAYSWSDVLILNAGKEWRELADDENRIAVAASWGWAHHTPAEVAVVVRELATLGLRGQRVSEIGWNDAAILALFRKPKFAER